MITKTMYQLSYCEVWDDYWYSGPVYENEADAQAAGEDLDQEEYTWLVSPVIVHLRSSLFKFKPVADNPLPL